MDGESVTSAAILAKLDAVLQEQHELKRLVHKLAAPVDVLHARQAAERIGRSTRTLERMLLSGVFTDGRAPGARTKGSPRLFFTDELDVYRLEGEAGVLRLRVELGRLPPGVPGVKRAEKGGSRGNVAGVRRRRRRADRDDRIRGAAVE